MVFRAPIGRLYSYVCTLISSLSYTVRLFLSLARSPTIRFPWAMRHSSCGPTWPPPPPCLSGCDRPRSEPATSSRMGFPTSWRGVLQDMGLSILTVLDSATKEKCWREGRNMVGSLLRLERRRKAFLREGFGEGKSSPWRGRWFGWG